MAKAGTLRVKIVGDTGPFQKSMKGLTRNVAKTAGKIAKVGAAAFAAAGAAAVTGAFKVAEFGDEVAKSSQKAGVGVEQFQELRFAFGQGGVEASTFDTALQKFNKRLGESATTGGTADEAFERLGVSLRDADGNVRDAGGALDEVLPKLAAIESDAERAAVAGDLFGQRAGPELAAALSDGVEGIDEAREKAQELGIVMGEDAAEAAEKFTDQWDDIKQSIGGLLRQGLTPVMEYMSSTVFPFIQDTAIPALKDFGEWIGPKLQAAASAVADFFQNRVMPVFEAIAGWWEDKGPTVRRVASETFDTVREKAGEVIEKIVEFGEAVKRWWDQQVKPRLDAFAEAVEEAWPAIEEAGEALKDMFAALGDLVSTVWQSIVGDIGDAEEDITTDTDSMVEAIEGFSAFVRDLANTVESAATIISESWDVLAGAVTMDTGQMAEGIDSLTGGAISRFETGVDEALTNVRRWFGELPGQIAELPGRIAAAASGMWDSIWHGFRDMINRVIGGWNRLSFTIPKIDVPGPFNFEGATVSTPNIPMLKDGGEVTKSGLAMVHKGERFSGTRGQFPIGGGGTTVNVTVQGSVISEGDLARKLTQQFRELQRRGATLGFA